VASYDFSNEDDVSRFDRDLDEYSRNRGLDWKQIDLVRCFRGLHESRPDIFYAVLDLKLSLSVMECDSIRMLKCQSRETPDETFEFYRYLTSFIVRYRAFYDKFMSFVIRVGYPKSLNSFDKAKSRNQAFYKIVSKSPAFFTTSGRVFIFDPELLTWLCEYLNEINSNFRTPEVHGTGKVRKWVFNPLALSDTPFDQFFAGCSNLVAFVGIVRTLSDAAIEDAKTERTR
jgi:hypothetical protein